MDTPDKIAAANWRMNTSLCCHPSFDFDIVEKEVAAACREAVAQSCQWVEAGRFPSERLPSTDIELTKHRREMAERVFQQLKTERITELTVDQEFQLAEAAHTISCILCGAVRKP